MELFKTIWLKELHINPCLYQELLLKKVMKTYNLITFL
jgi:hypothetical protein